MLSSGEIREKFLTYFADKGHTRVPSSSLVPYQDPTLLFTNAGMNQFKNVFLGLEKRPYLRATSSQKCVRAGGKHNDLETVGKTARHHTFFEMLGNFSFGDYFKKEAILYAWEFLTRKLELPQERLYVTIYLDDDEAAELWQELTDLPNERIIRLGEKDNFWSMGDTGPCGPCSEVLFDQGEEYACGVNCGIGKCDCDRFLEIWNLVFMQYNRDTDGKMTPLPQPSIDTGMGLERITAVVQNVQSNYDTDLLQPLLQYIQSLSGRTYYPDERGFAFRVIADHIRSCAFIIADGILPGNDGRGYVLRRILRRAIRFGKVLGMESPFFYKILPVLTTLMQDSYPELGEKEKFLIQVIKGEEERFRVTLNDGLLLAEEIVQNLRQKGSTIIPGEEAFRLYDTFGFPLDLTEDIAAENKFTVDLPGFEQAMKKQKEKARIAREETQTGRLSFTAQNLSADLPVSIFSGYDLLEDETEIVAIFRDGQEIGEARGGDKVNFVVSQTPFYAEAGGQVGDQGELRADQGKITIITTKKAPGGQILHQGIVSGKIITGEHIKLSVDSYARKSIAQNHTATHLLHQALQMVLGEHVQQAGSLVEKSHLRFDFTHFTALSKEEKRKIEDLVNRKIAQALPVETIEMPFEKAKKWGATALFGEKYGETVRVVQIGEFSKELCGGTHVKNTGELGLFKIVSESAIGSGIRRIEAVTGQGIRPYLLELDSQCEELSRLLKTPLTEIAPRVRELLTELKQKETTLHQLRNDLARTQVNDILTQTVKIQDISVVISQVNVPGMENLRDLSDILRDKLDSGVVILAALIDEKVNFVVAATKDVIARGVHAGKLSQEIAKIIGGGGGGRPDMAQAGGKNVTQLDQALKKAVEIVKNQLSK